jgi:hypothetical protein
VLQSTFLLVVLVVCADMLGCVLTPPPPPLQAYILKLLDQDGEFDALHWFDSVRMHIEKRKADINEQKTKKKNSEEDMQHLLLTLKKLSLLQVRAYVAFVCLYARLC